MKKRLFTISSLIAVLAVIGLLLPAKTASAATATITDVPDPDAYTCGQSGYITFEKMSDGTNLSAGAINGVQFTTTNGYTWLVGDFATGSYNGKYPNGGYTSQGTHWAWLGVSQGAGRIDFVSGPASVFSLLVSNGLSPVQLDAYNADNTLLATAGPASNNYNTGHMAELKITRDSADIAYVIVHDTGNYFLVDSICTNASGVPNQALYDFKQNLDAKKTPVPWATQRLYEFNLKNCDTMANIGCAITSLTDVLSSYGMKSLPNGELNPGNLNHYLGLDANAVIHDTNCLIYWDNVPRLFPYGVVNRMPSSIPPDQYTTEIDAALQQGNLVIVGFPPCSKCWHYVVFYQKAPNTPDGSPDYLIADPYRYFPDHSTMAFSKAYNTTVKKLEQAANIQIVVIKNQTPKPGRSWVIVGRSPIEMLITDPTGAQTGFNPATGSSLLNIPDSSYGFQPGLSDDNGVNPSLPGGLYFGQTVLEEGTYKVQVTGTGSGVYHLDFAIAGDPNNPFPYTIAGMAAPGQTDTYFVSTIAGQPISIQLQVNIDIKPGSDPAPINPNSSGVTPVVILSTTTFNAITVDPSGVRFGPKGAKAVHSSVEDANGDGLSDLMLQFTTQQTGIRPSDTQACLTGKTKSGLAIGGCDPIVIVP